MATRTKTVSYVFGTVVDDTPVEVITLWSPVSVWITELSPFFTSVVLEWTFQDSVEAIANIERVGSALTLGTNTPSPITNSIQVLNSGENQIVTYAFDYTDYFNTNWTGTDMGVTASYYVSGAVSSCHTAKLNISYQYDDTSATTRTKTIYIPIESTGSFILSGSWCALGGTGAIFASSSLPESECSVKQSWIELWTHTRELTTPNWTASLQVAGANSSEFWRKKNTLQSSLNCYAIKTVTLTDSAQLLEVSMSGQGQRLPLLGGVHGITYTYNHDNSTTIWNSIMLGVSNFPQATWGGTSTNLLLTVASCSQDSTDFYIQEPEPITLQTSSINLYWSENNQTAVSQRVYIASGDQTGSMDVATSSYMVSTANLDCHYSVIHKIDATGRDGTATAFGTLTRGKNNITTRFAGNTTTGFYGRNGYYLLNYTSGKHSDGDGAHNHSVYRHIETWDDVTTTAVRQRMIASSSLSASHITEDKYYINSVIAQFGGSILSTLVDVFNLSAGAALSGLGWKTLFSIGLYAGYENVYYRFYGDCTNSFQLWKNSVDTTKLLPTNVYAWKFDNTCRMFELYLGFWTTYHTINYIVSGSLEGFTGDGSGIIVDVFRDNDEKQLLSLTTLEGLFTGSWYDNTEDIYCVAYQDSTHKGRSNNIKLA